MLVYAGIDEAGYGPLLGPLIVARSVFIVEPADPDRRPPSLWSHLRASVCRKPGDRRGRIAVNDSKRLYNRSVGLRNLERGVLAFLHAAEIRPVSLDALLSQVGLDEASRTITLAWYHDRAGGPQLPVQLDATDLERATLRLARTADRTGVRLDDVAAAIVYEDRFNALVASSRSKAACSWRFVAAHLRAIWERYGEFAPHVIIDRQGGRRDYLELLASLFPWSSLRLIDAQPHASSYEIGGDGRSMKITVPVGSERFHLPVAFASMCAKYLRELLMMRFQRFWQEHAPGVRPSAGYFVDGKRFLGEIEPLLAELHIAREMLVRIR